MKTASIVRTSMLALTLFASGVGYAGSTGNVDTRQLKAIRDQVNIGLDMAAYAKLSVSEMYLSTGKWPNNNDEAKALPIFDTDFEIIVGSNGVIIVTYLNPAAIAGKTLVLTPAAGEIGTVNWACKSADIAADYLPKRCQ
ncbi:MAG: pilin [Arenimonas sp.]